MANTALADTRSELDAGACALGLPLDAAQLDRLLAYQVLLAKWNRVYNLTAIRDTGDMLTHHLLDSLAAVPRIAGLVRRVQPEAPRVLDVGSGGGLPGIPLAIACPDIGVTMVDIVQKKTAFLTQCRAELGLANAQSHWGHVEKLADATGYGVITSRAFAELNDFVRLAGHLLAPGGRMVAMKGVRPDAEIARLPEGWAVESIERLTVPGLPAERHLVILAPSA
ncbi:MULTISPECIES: 16S rRNA (guanine(527)-N(7))-methyltransferase RsmG [Ralstonia solanacearum species complex]|uniref:16S rRNA (guanine(527)-N(7))-methyltransferase RsmG n=1 Tax=Ralstonia solanacearum species complex TaxID=3116862 RepID=UPI000E574F46|nr:16S rRNA (guanine(527)-N(7))-methyltransferase RsmG [Ralstonia solanacearum]BEU70555.1 16S rRNA (guanine(527)-N(7))-methyltransferase RsmG [Ralstonia pseudosolanacearum]AXV75602.1 16S rRNA (guanine(527)-N(7))-methyltransferase RsmG [Ralstonia solanacearum]AXV89602.1 16S rRNA (guanine(527)-N(7))-methyltransferase RsmG [Ralstonia solanacearum]AXW17808.1 16S rRNA (guanine(527)-N(7))-methyltransferase RsmG [Ralstonia solanacearum]AXW74514.1 16S rRNA (guanine(527)-N(7))-methyltransferase RsmG [R